ncbi:hypothetical protein L3Q82_016883 [Scortum barcoo]|uniref:Uncharacterized protein n=1 Tax=Scortum barcoo TaxID=214431 RepID=A0ACB8X952_9TELE|nr:hypothetical protein L3Q82_016883 [Scortum barcoo]
MPEVGEPSKTFEKELMEQLQQCQQQRHDVSLMLHTATQGRLHFSLRYKRLTSCTCDTSERSVCSLTPETSVHPFPFACRLQDFIQGVMRRFPQFPFLWVGLTDMEQEGRWLWGDGTDVQHYMPVIVEWDTDHRDCADLRGGGSLFAASCDAYGPWACKRDS